MKPIALTSETFDANLANTDQPVLVDFWAEWCGPCKMMSPILDQLATEQAGRATIAKVDVDAFPDLQARFGIRAIPTLIVTGEFDPQTQAASFRSLSNRSPWIRDRRPASALSAVVPAGEP